jgi:orotate phosphoribosyltransferase
LDRRERGQDDRSAVDEVQVRYGIPVISIASVDQLIELLAEDGDQEHTLAVVRAYRSEYGVG